MSINQSSAYTCFTFAAANTTQVQGQLPLLAASVTEEQTKGGRQCWLKETLSNDVAHDKTVKTT